MTAEEKWKSVLAYKTYLTTTSIYSSRKRFFQDLCYLVRNAIESFLMHTHLQKCSFPGKVSFSLVLFLFGCSKLPCILERPYSILKTLTLLKYLPYYNPGLLPLADGAVCQVARQRLFGRFPPGGGFVQPALVPSVAGGARAGWLDVSII